VHYNSMRLMTEAGLRLGEIYNEEKAKRGSFRAQEFYRSRGFLDSSVYYEGTKKVRTKKPFVYVIFPGVEATERRFIDGLTALFRGASNFLSHPVAVTKTLFGKGKLAIPIYLVSEGKRFRIIFEGNESFGKNELMELVDIDTPGVDIFFLEKTRERIEEFYRPDGEARLFGGYRQKKKEGLSSLRLQPRQETRTQVYRVLGRGRGSEGYL